MPGQELTASQRDTLLGELTEDRKAELLAEIDVNVVLEIGEQVLTDALRLEPSMTDVQDSPPSFFSTCTRLVEIAPQPEVAFKIVGEAVVIAREYTKQVTAFTKEQ